MKRFHARLHSRLFNAVRSSVMNFLFQFFFIGLTTVVFLLTNRLLGPNPEVAAQEVRPGASNPIVPAARRVLFPDHQAFITMPTRLGAIEEGFFPFTAWARSTDLQSLELQDTLKIGLDQIIEARAAAGRILSQDTDDVAVAIIKDGESGLEIDVQVLNSSGAILSTDRNTQLVRPHRLGGEVFPPPVASVSLAVGNLSPEVDEDGLGHDEVVLCDADQTPEEGVVAIRVSVFDYSLFDELGRARVTWTSLPNSLITSESDWVKQLTDSILACTTGDVTGDGVDEILVAYLIDSQRLRVTTLAYRTDNEALTLQEVGMPVTVEPVRNPEPGNTILGPPSFSGGNVDVAVGDLNANGRLDVAVATVNQMVFAGDMFFYPSIYVLSSDRDGNLAWQSSFARFPNDSMTVATAADFVLGGKVFACRPTVQEKIIARPFACETMRVRVVTGLFQFHSDPSAGFGFNRRQVAIVWNREFESGEMQGGLRSLTLKVSDDLQTITPVGDILQLPQQACDTNFCPSGNRFSVTAGGFLGAGDLQNPTTSLLITNWETTQRGDVDGSAKGLFHAFWLQSQPVNETGAGGGLALVWEEVLLNGQEVNGPQNARLPTIAWDRQGASLVLGGPVHLVASDLVRPIYMIAEPPKHLYWWPPNTDVENGAIQNVSRLDTFFVQLQDSEQQVYSHTKKNKTDWAIGGSLGASVKSSIEGGGGFALLKASAKASLEVSGKISYDHTENKANYEKDYRSETRTFTGSTTRGDLIVAEVQTHDIWRYPISGTPLENAPHAFWDISFPGVPMRAEGEGTTFSWYSPPYENGNILSYPSFTASSYTPEDCCAEYTFLQPDNDQKNQPVTMARPFWNDVRLAFDGNALKHELKFAETRGGGTEKTFTNKLAENLDVKVGFKVKGEILGAKTEDEVRGTLNFHNSKSWSDTETSDSTTSTSTGFTLNKPAGNPNEAYFFFPVFYLATDGTTKVKHAVNILGAGRTFWTETYGRLPDPALKLPRRFSPIVDPGQRTTWVPNTSADAKEIRGFFVRLADPDQAGTFPFVSGAVTEGTRLRLEVEVHNYSVGQNVSGVPIQFEAAPYSATSGEEGPHVSLTCEQGSILDLSLTPLERKIARCVWDTIGFGPPLRGVAQDYRIYVTLDANNQIEEIYEGTEGPGQNNQGWGLLSISHSEETHQFPTPTATVPKGADVSLKEEAVAIHVNGRWETDAVRLGTHQNVPLRVCVTTDQTQRGYHHVLIYDGHPQDGAPLLLNALLPGVDLEGDTCAMLHGVRFTEPGEHIVYAQVLEAEGDGEVGNAVDVLPIHIEPHPVVPSSFDEGAATGLTSQRGRGRFEISGIFPYTGDLDLESSMLIVGSTLEETLGTGELIPGVEKLTGQSLVLFAQPQRHPVDKAIRTLPVVEGYQHLPFFSHPRKLPLVAKLQTLLGHVFRDLPRFDRPERGTTAVFKTLEGQEPHVQVRVQQRREELEVRVKVEAAEILQPARCGSLRVTELTTVLRFIDQENPPVDLIFDKRRWACRVNAQGEVTALRLPRG